MSLHKNVTYILLEIKHVRKCSMSLLLIPNIGNMNDVIFDQLKMVVLIVEPYINIYNIYNYVFNILTVERIQSHCIHV